VQSNSGIVPLRDVELHYDVFGSGRPLLLLSGGPGASPEYLYPLVDDLYDEWQCIVFHQRGTGRSVLEHFDEENINLRTAVDDVESLRKHVNIDQWTIIGHSWGGMLGAAYAASYPDRTTALIFVGSPGTDYSCSEYANDNLLSYLTLEERRIIEHWSRAERIEDPEAQRHISMAYAPSCVFDRTLEPVVAKIFMSINSKMESLIKQSLKQEQFNVTEPLSSFTKPVTIIQGRQDYIGEGAAIRLQAAFSKSKLIWIERASHFPWLDQPKVFRQALIAALSR
jgi:proline iminopeptidase